MELIIKYLLIACFVYVIIRIMMPYIAIFARFMFNEPFRWDKYVEKPRLVFYGIGLLLMHSSYDTILEYTGEPWGLFFYSGCFIFLGGIFMSQITWTKRFERIFIPRIKEKFKSPRSFNISASESQLGMLYDNMVRFDMIIIDKTSKDEFVRCFLMDWDRHDSKIHLKLKNPACKEFYELFKSTFPKNDLQLIDFIKNSDLLRREDGRRYNYDTVRNALTRNRVSKRSKELEVVFSLFS